MPARPPNPSWTTLTALAKVLGLHKMTVSVGVKNGRLSGACFERDANGRPWITDLDQAQKEWAENCKVEHRPAHIIDREEARAAAMTVLEPAGESTEKPGTVVGAAERKRHWEAKTAELEFREQAKELANVAIFEKRVADLAARLKTKLLGIPSRLKQAEPETSIRQLNVLEDLIRETLEDPA